MGVTRQSKGTSGWLVGRQALVLWHSYSNDGHITWQCSGGTQPIKATVTTSAVKVLGA